MDTSTQFRLDTVDDAIAANADDPAQLAKLIAYRAQILGNTATGRPSRDVGELETPKRRSDNGTNVGSRTADAPEATAPQMRYLAKLTGERVTEGAPWHFQNLLGKLASSSLNKSEASELIDWLNDQPVQATAPTRRPASGGQLRMVNARRASKGLRALAESELFMDEVDEELAQIEAAPAPTKAERATKAAGGELESGMYKVGDTIYKVYKAVHGSGKMCAKELVVIEFDDAEADVSFEYRGLAERFVSAADRMSLEDAKKFGAIYGVCCVCAATLTDETSIAEGIGPVCGKRV